MDVGLVVTRYGDAVRVGDGICVAGDGYAHHEAVFRCIVFRPFVEEVCLGWIAESNEEGIRISLGFFEDIFVPAHWMLRPSQYQASNGLWVWTPDYGEGDEDGAEEYRYEMDIGSEIRFKVKAINFTRITNTAKGVQATTTTTSKHTTSHPNIASGDERPIRKRSSSIDLTDAKKPPATMQIIVSICEDGLGLTSWWSSAKQEEDENE